MNTKRLAIAVSIAAAFAGSAPATAGQVVGTWFMGDWRCTLDGRPTRIVVNVVSVDHGSNQGDVGTSIAGAERRARFWDRGSWVNLSLGQHTATTLHFRHPDGNNWFLRRTSATQATGYSTWQARRYPLACTKAR